MGQASVNPISGCHLTSSAESNKVKLLSPAERVSTCGNQGNDSRSWSRAPCVRSCKFQIQENLFLLGFSFANRGAEMSAKVFFTSIAGMVCYKGQQMFSSFVTG
jgi:hypothetical protein